MALIAHFDKIFFMRAFIINWRRNFLSPFVNQSLYKLTFKQRDLQLRNFIQWYWGEFLRRSRSDFFKNRSRFFKSDFKKYFLRFYCKLLFYFTILCIFAWYFMSIAPKFSIKILKRDFKKTLKRFFQKSFDYLQGLIKI